MTDNQTKDQAGEWERVLEEWENGSDQDVKEVVKQILTAQKHYFIAELEGMKKDLIMDQLCDHCEKPKWECECSSRHFYNQALDQAIERIKR